MQMATEVQVQSPSQAKDGTTGAAEPAAEAVTMRRRTRAMEDAENTVSILENQLTQVQRLSKAAQELQEMLRQMRDNDNSESAKPEIAMKTNAQPAPDQIVADHIKGLSELFDEVDIDGSGEICLEELRIVLTQKGYDDTFVEHLFCHLDINKDALITRQEFSDAMKFIPKEIFTECHVVPNSTLLRFFDEFDTDKSGTVDLKKLANALRSNGISEEVIRSYFKHLDLDGNNIITREEYGRCIGVKL